MTLKDRGTLTCPKLLDYFLDACRPPEQWAIGMEVEKQGLDARTGAPIPYEGPGPAVRKVLEAYHARRGGEPIYEGEHIIGVDGPWGTVSLEPGGQIEWSSRPCPGLAGLRGEIDAHLAAMGEIGAASGVRWLDVAVDPVHSVSEMPWMPKARYTVMRRYLGARGRLAHRMMTQTTSIQCAFDFGSPDDWARKFRAGALLAPVAVALFANSSRADRRDSGFRSFREAIWRETDPDRCGLPAVVFEPGFGVEAWVEWLLDVPTLFVNRGRGLLPTGGVPFRELLARIGCEAVSMEDWELHLSAIFTEVRSYTYIEVRSADLQPDRRIFAVPAFWTGILYHPESLAAAIDLGSGHATYPTWLQAMESASRLALDGEAGGRPIRELAGRALSLATHGLSHGAVGADRGGIAVEALAGLAAELELPIREEPA